MELLVIPIALRGELTIRLFNLVAIYCVGAMKVIQFEHQTTVLADLMLLFEFVERLPS